MKQEEIEKAIKQQRKKVNEQIHRTLGNKRKKKSRIRSAGEIESLNQISIKRWQKAVEEGKIRKINERKWYYDYN